MLKLKLAACLALSLPLVACKSDSEAGQAPEAATASDVVEAPKAVRMEDPVERIAEVILEDPVDVPVAVKVPADAPEEEPEEEPIAAADREPVEVPAEPIVKGLKEMGPWVAGDTIPSGKQGIPNIEILQVHANGEGNVCGTGKSATLRYKAMKKNGTVLDPGTRPFTFRVGAGRAIKGWDVIVSRMRVGDSFTLIIPEQLAYGAAEGDLKFDMELLSVK